MKALYIADLALFAVFLFTLEYSNYFTGSYIISLLVFIFIGLPALAFFSIEVNQ